MSRNRLANVHNAFQDYKKFPRVLCVCSAGLLRSPTLAWVLSNPPYNFNTRAAGSEREFALVPVDEALLLWADHVIFVNEDNKRSVKERFELPEFKITTLNLPDNFSYREDGLVAAIEKQLVNTKLPSLVKP